MNEVIKAFAVALATEVGRAIGEAIAERIRGNDDDGEAPKAEPRSGPTIDNWSPYFSVGKGQTLKVAGRVAEVR